MQTRQQEDALRALKHIQAIKDKDLKKTYSRAVYRFPILVRQNGLQQTLGFYAGKAAGGSGDAEKLFLSHLGQALQLSETPDLELLGKDLLQYMYYTRRCLEVSIWYRRFVESILKIDKTGTPTEEDNKEVTNEKSE